MNEIMHCQKFLFSVLHTGCIICNIFIISGFNVFSQQHSTQQLSQAPRRIQYERKNWNCHTSGNLKVYYYGSGNELAQMAAWYTHECIVSLSDELGIPYDGDAHVLIYSNYADFRNSNLGTSRPENTGNGWNPEIPSDRIVLVCNGRLSDVQRQIRKEVAGMLIRHYFLGSTFRSQAIGQALIRTPAWFYAGLADYIAGMPTDGTEAWFRTRLLSGELRNFNLVQEYEAERLGYFIWSYIVNIYGHEQLHNILSLTKATRSADKALEITLGVSYKTLTQNFQDYFLKAFVSNKRPEQHPTVLANLYKSGGKPGMPEMNAKGDKMAWATEKANVNKVCVSTVKDGKVTCILKAEAQGEQEDLLAEKILLKWNPVSDQLMVIIRERGELQLISIDIITNECSRHNLDYFENIDAFEVSPDGTRLVLSAVQDGHSDLFVISLEGMLIRRLTNDVFDDVDPVFIDNNQLVFSSNRNVSAVFQDGIEMREVLKNEHDLFLLSCDNKDHVNQAIQLTGTSGLDETQPVRTFGNSFSYLSTSHGKADRYLGRIDSTVFRVDSAIHYKKFMSSFRISEKPEYLFQQRFSETNNMFYEQTGLHMFTETPLPDSIEGTLFIPFFVSPEIEISNKRNEKVDDPVNPFDHYRLSEKALSITGHSMAGSLEKSLNNELKHIGFKKKIPDISGFYLRSVSAAVDFGSCNFTFQPVFDAQYPEYHLPELNLLTGVSASDLLEDRHLDLTARISGNRADNEFLLKYRDLTGRLDKEYLCYYRSIRHSGVNGITDLGEIAIAGLLGWSLSNRLFAEGQLQLDYSHRNYLANDPANQNKTGNGILRPGLVFSLNRYAVQDDSYNLMTGYTWKFFAGVYQTFGEKQSFLLSAGFDIRKYIKMNRYTYFALRGAAGTSAGSGKLLFFIGGSDNQVISEQEQPIYNSTIENYICQTFVGGVRGLKTNIMQGTSYALCSGELRIPVVRAFTRLPLQSGFLYHLQAIAFADAGAAWTGWSPFSDENSMYFRYNFNGSDVVNLVEHHDPVLGAIGIGFRSLILGCFIRADYASAIIDGTLNKPGLVVSLGFDF